MKNIENSIPYTHCLNCGTELSGRFCHKCGQQATSKTPKLKDFIAEYLNNAFIWDPQFFKTTWRLISRPGYLTNEYMSGKFISQEHPLKLNMFLLLAFVSMFLLFSNPNSESSSGGLFEKNEVIYPALQVQFLKNNPDFAEKIQNSPLDTVQLYAPLNLATEHSDIITKVSVVEQTQGEGMDKWVAVIPRTFIEDKIIIPNEEGYYEFSTEDSVISNELSSVKEVWSKMIQILTTYFPIIMLFTAPLLAFAVALIQRKNRLPFINHFIFSLHYMALLELLMILIYVLHLTVSPSMAILQWILRIDAGLYLTIAYHKVYEPKSWIRSIIKALFTYAVYMLNLLAVLVVILIIACFIVGWMMA